MDPISLVVTALAAGAAAALQDGAKSAIKAGYARLRELAKKRFKNPADGEFLLQKHEAAPDTWQDPLAAELAEAGAGNDGDLLAAAQELMKLLDTAGSQAGKYVVSVQDSHGIQVGDHNTQTNYFKTGPT
jgi:RIP homotypic interaction motif